jgi:hypothetical protein
MKSFFEFYQKMLHEQQVAPDAMTTGTDDGALMNVPSTQNPPQDQNQGQEPSQDMSGQEDQAPDQAQAPDATQDQSQGIAPPVGFEEISKAMDTLQKTLPQDDEEIAAKFKEFTDLLSKKGVFGKDQQANQ